MGEFQVAHNKARRVRVALGRRTNALPEKRQLVAKAPTFVVEEITREVPPLRFEIRVDMMVSRKLILPARLRLFPIGAERAERRAMNDKVEARVRFIRFANSPPDHPSRPPGRQDAGDHCRRKDPKRRQREGAPRKGELDRPAKERAIDHTREHKRKAKAGHHSNRGRQHSQHRGFPKQEPPDLGRASADRSHNRQLAGTLRDQNCQGEENSRDRDDDRDRPQHVGHRESLVEDFENARAQRPVRIDHELAVAAELLPESVNQCFAGTGFLQVNGDTAHAIVVPELNEGPLAHVNDPLIAGVIKKDPGDGKLADALGRGQLDRLALPQAMAAHETLRNKDARLGLKSTHDFRAVAPHELELPPLAPAHDRDRDGFVTHRQLHFAKSIHRFDRRMSGQKLHGRRGEERRRSDDFVRSRRDEEVGEQGIVDPRRHRLAEGKHHHAHSDSHRHRRGQRGDSDRVSEKRAGEVRRAQLRFDRGFPTARASRERI